MRSRFSALILVGGACVASACGGTDATSGSDSGGGSRDATARSEDADRIGHGEAAMVDRGGRTRDASSTRHDATPDHGTDGQGADVGLETGTADGGTTDATVHDAGERDVAQHDSPADGAARDSGHDAGRADAGTDAPPDASNPAAPIAVDDNVVGPEASPCTQVMCLANDIDPSGAPLTAMLESYPTFGDVFDYDCSQPNCVGAPALVGAPSSGSYCYLPFHRFFFGNDSFTYEVFDGDGGPGNTSNVATVTITIND